MQTASAKQNSIRSLILIDEQPVRQSLAAELKKLQRTLEKLKAEITHHETVVRPSFNAWYFSLFGARIAIVQKLRSALEEKMTLLHRMRELYSWGGFTRKRAFEQANEDIDSMKNEVDGSDAKEHEFDIDGDESARDGAHDDPYASDATTSSWRVFHDDGDEALGSHEEKTVRDLKYYYRRLVQVLHPDRGGQQTPELKQLWQETQQAYRDHDLERLRFLWTECVLAANPFSGELRLSELSEAIAKLKEKIKQARKEKRDLARTDPTWNFQKKNKTVLIREIERELEEAEDDLRSGIYMLEREVESFAESGGRRRSRRHREEDQLSFD